MSQQNAMTELEDSMKSTSTRLLISLIFTSLIAGSAFAQVERPNILLVMMDDLTCNFEAVAKKDAQGEVLPGQILAIAPHMNSLAKNGVTFMNAFANVPLCNPSRASMFTGILPNKSRFFEYGNPSWRDNEVLNANKNLQELLLSNDAYANYFTGKVYHAWESRGFSRTRGITMPTDYAPDYRQRTGPGQYQRVPRLDTPGSAPQSALDGLLDINTTFGALSMLSHSDDEDRIVWYRRDHPRQDVNRYGNNGTSSGDFSFANYIPDVDPNHSYDPERIHEFYYKSDDDRDKFNDELSVTYFKRQLEEHFSHNTFRQRPFFFSVGFVLPHAPYIAPDKYFKQYDFHEAGTPYTWDSDLPNLDLTDLLPLMARSQLNQPDDESGHRYYKAIKNAYENEPDKFVGVKQFIHAYLATVTFADELFGELMEHLRTADDPRHPGMKLIDTTTVILAADHGYHVGSKQNFWKNTLWDDGSRVPFIVSDPRHKGNWGSIVNEAISLIDVYPTIAEIAFEEETETVLAGRSRVSGQKPVPIDGTSLFPFIKDSETTLEQWGGMPLVPTLVKNAYGPKGRVPDFNSLSLRSKDHRYVRHRNEQDKDGNFIYEEFYDYRTDPQELVNQIDNPEYAQLIASFRSEMKKQFSDQLENPWIPKVERNLDSETLIAGFHSPLKGRSTATLINRAKADDLPLPGITATVSHGSNNDIEVLKPGALAAMLTEVSSNLAYGDKYEHVTATLKPESGFVINGRASTHLLFHLQNESGKDVELTSLHFDLKSERMTDQTFELSYVPDPQKIVGSGFEPKGTSYILPTVNGVDSSAFKNVTLPLFSLPLERRMLPAGGEIHFALKLTKGGGVPLRHLDNVAWTGIVEESARPQSKPEPTIKVGQ